MVKEDGCRKIGTSKIAGTNIWPRDDNCASLVCWQSRQLYSQRKRPSQASRVPLVTPNIFPKSNGLSARKWWPPLPPSGHTCSTLGLAESAQGNAPQFARRVFHRKKENAECVEALLLQISLQPGTFVQTMASKPTS